MAYLEHARRGKNAAWRYGVGLVGSVLLGMLVAVLLGFALQMLHLLSPQFVRSIQDAGQPTKFYPANGVIFGLLLMSFVLMGRWLHGKTFGDIIGVWSWRRF